MKPACLGRRIPSMALPHATPIVPLLLALTLALGGCDSSLDSQLLTEEIPPCTPAPGSSVDPCEPDVERPWPWGVEGIGSPLALVVEHVSQRDMLDVGDAWVLAPHIVLRGTYLPNTTRCTAGNPFRPSPYVASELGYDEYDYPDSFSINCYTDLSVSAYVLGEGPSALTVQTLFYPYVEGTGEHLRQEVETDEYAGWVAGRERSYSSVRRSTSRLKHGRSLGYGTCSAGRTVWCSPSILRGTFGDAIGPTITGRSAPHSRWSCPPSRRR